MGSESFPGEVRCRIDNRCHEVVEMAQWLREKERKSMQKKREACKFC